MAIYHLSVSTRAKGYGAAHAMYIERSGKYAGREDLEAAASGNMPAWACADPHRFWQAADQYERANGRAYTEIEISLPRELSAERREALVREFVRDTLGDRHAYTWAIHNPAASDGQAQPHVHLMFSERVNDGIARDPGQYFKRWNAKDPQHGGAGKDRSMSARSFVVQVREQWAQTANRFMEREGLETRIDHRSYRDIAVAENSRLAELEPQQKRGVSVHLQARGVMSDLAGDVRDKMARNGERLIADPRIALDALTAHQSVFTRRDIERFVMGHTDGAEQYQAALMGILASPELLALKEPAVADGTAHVERYTSQAVLDVEARLLLRVGRLADQRSARTVPRDVILANASGRIFNMDQVKAFWRLLSSDRIATIHGSAGTGKSYVLSAMRKAYESAGFEVHGAILQGKTAEDLERDSGIRSQTIHSFLTALEKGHLALSDRSVIVVDEAGMVGSRQMEKLLEHVEASGARLRLVGDTRQLHAVDFGDAFGQIAQRTPVASLARIRRQQTDWQREASEHFARHEIGAGLAAYEKRGGVRALADERAAREALIAQWHADRQESPEQSQVILAHSNVSREALNRMVREIRKAAGELGGETQVQTEKGSLAVAPGERVLFGRNDYGKLQVRNGTLGTLRSVEGDCLLVELDSGRRVEVNTRDYRHLEHGYALTVHKSQGMTVDRTYLLATPSMSAETAYVGMTRHRLEATLFYGLEQFEDRGGLAQALSRSEHKTFSAMYEQDALKRLADQQHPVADRPMTLGQRLDARGATETPRAASARKSRQVGAEREAMAAAKPMTDQVEMFDRSAELVASKIAQRALRVAKHAEERLWRRRQALRALVTARPAQPTGLLAGLRRKAYLSQLAEWEQHYGQVQRLVQQAEKTSLAVRDIATPHRSRQRAEVLLQKSMPKLTERVMAFRAEQKRERNRELERQWEQYRSRDRSRDRGMSR